MTRLAIAFVFVLTGAVLGAQQPALETVPSAVRETERSVARSRLAWSAASRNLEGDLLRRPAAEMHARVGRARAAKMTTLDALAKYWRSLAAEVPGTEWLQGGPGPRRGTADRTLSTLDGTERALRKALAETGNRDTVEDAVRRASILAQLDLLQTLRQEVESRKAAESAVTSLDDERRLVDEQLGTVLDSLRRGLESLAESAEFERGVWNYLYDTYDAAIDSNPARTSAAPRPASRAIAPGAR